MVIGFLVVTVVFYNLDLEEQQTPPIEWYTNSKAKCVD